MIQATVVADSIAPHGVRLTTMLLTYPSIIHQDILTHRTIYKSQQASDKIAIEVDSNKSTNSNRAKPTKQILRDVLNNPFVPTRFPKRAVSMHSSKGYHTGWRHQLARHIWLKTRYVSLLESLALMGIGVHKQIANRPLATWQYTTLVCTAIDVWWLHFFELRTHHTAQDEVQQVAGLAHTAYRASTPTLLHTNEWHLPFVSPRERLLLPQSTCIALSVARCARTSYAKSHSDMISIAGFRPIDEDIALYNRLVPQKPEHAGPKEHQAQVHPDPTHISGTLLGYDQLRHVYVDTAIATTYPPQHQEPS